MGTRGKLVGIKNQFKTLVIILEIEDDAEFKYALDLVGTLPAREWSPLNKYWTAPITDKALYSLRDAGFVFTEKLQQYLKDVDFQFKEKQVKENPKLKGFRPYQVEGVNFILERDCKGIIGDDMGLGKTIQGIGVLLMRPDLRPGIIVCPSTVKYSWQDHLNEWIPDARVEVLSGRKSRPLSDADYYVINYDILGEVDPEARAAELLRQKEAKAAGRPVRAKKLPLIGWLHELMEINPQIIIGDESHYLKDSRSTRSRCFVSIARHCKGIVLMSGTPIEDGADQWFTVLNLVAPSQFPNEWKFKMTYCKKDFFGHGFSGTNPKKIDELHSLASRVMIRRMKSEVLTELPPKQKIIVPLEFDSADYDRAEKSFFDWLEHTDASEKEQETRMFALRQIAYAGKRKAVIQWVDEYLSTGKKLVLGLYHHKAIDDLSDVFKDVCVTIDGSVSAEFKRKAEVAFQTNKTVRLMIAQIQSVTGMTLTAASATATAELHWTPGVHEQFEDRVNRIGQTADSIFAYYLIGRGTVEERIMKLLDKKKGELSRLMDGKESTMFDAPIKSILKYLRK